MNSIYIILLVLSLLQMADINQHNKTVRQLWPDQFNQQHIDTRHRVEMQYIVPVLQIIILAFYIVSDLISLFR